jgi:hypothetical protein
MLVAPATLAEAVGELDALGGDAVGKPFETLPITPFAVLAALQER